MCTSIDSGENNYWVNAQVTAGVEERLVSAYRAMVSKTQGTLDGNSEDKSKLSTKQPPLVKSDSWLTKKNSPSCGTHKLSFRKCGGHKLHFAGEDRVFVIICQCSSSRTGGRNVCNQSIAFKLFAGIPVSNKLRPFYS